MDAAHLFLLCFTECHSAVSIMEIKRAAKRDEIPPFVFEDTDSDIYIHAQLTTQCHLLTKALNSMVVAELVFITVFIMLWCYFRSLKIQRDKWTSSSVYYCLTERSPKLSPAFRELGRLV